MNTKDKLKATKTLKTTTIDLISKKTTLHVQHTFLLISKKTTLHVRAGGRTLRHNQILSDG